MLDPILAPIEEEMLVTLSAIEVEYKHWCDRMGLNGKEALSAALAVERRPGLWENPTPSALSAEMERLHMRDDGVMSQDRRKKVTSALRRMLPNGQANEMGMSINIRSLRHQVQVRTHRAAEWEIRYIFNQVYDLVRAKFPMIFYKARTKDFEGLREVYGMKQQPFDIDPSDPTTLQFYATPALQKEVAKRELTATTGES